MHLYPHKRTCMTLETLAMVQWRRGSMVIHSIAHAHARRAWQSRTSTISALGTRHVRYHALQNLLRVYLLGRKLDSMQNCKSIVTMVFECYFYNQLLNCTSKCNVERDCIKSRRDKIGITRQIMTHQVLYIYCAVSQ